MGGCDKSNHIYLVDFIKHFSLLYRDTNFKTSHVKGLLKNTKNNKLLIQYKQCTSYHILSYTQPKIAIREGMESINTCMRVSHINRTSFHTPRLPTSRVTQTPLDYYLISDK